MKRKIIAAFAVALLAFQAEGLCAWDKTKPTDDNLLSTAPSLIRANWDAIETGTDSALQITNAKVSATAAIVDTKLAQLTTADKVHGTALTGLSSIPNSADGQVPLANGGTAANLTDPNADRVMFWDDSAGAVDWLSAGNGLTISTTTVAVDSASDTVDGIVELATVAETDTGTDATRAVTPDGLAGSNFGEKGAQLLVFDFTSDVTTGDGAYYLEIPSSYNGMNLVEVAARVITAGTTGTTDIQIHNVTDTQDMLSTKLTIDSGETSSSTAATAAVINGTYDDVATYDLLRIDVDATSTTKAKGLIVTLIFRLP